MKVKVEQRHIDEGEPACAFNCAVALAVSGAANTQTVSVDEWSICVDDYVYRTPAAVKRFIERYDDGMECQPFEFELVDEGP